MANATRTTSFTYRFVYEDKEYTRTTHHEYTHAVIWIKETERDYDVIIKKPYRSKVHRRIIMENYYGSKPCKPYVTEVTYHSSLALAQKASIRDDEARKVLIELIARPEQ